jgi:hypothetical protein
MGEWVPARDDGRKWRWSSTTVTVGRGEDARCRWEGENGVWEEKGGKERVFGGSNDGERRSRHRFRWGITVPVSVEGENGVGEEKGGKERVFGGSNGGERRHAAS